VGHTASVDQVRAWSAYGDSWWVQGGLRAHRGGGREELPGVRLSASGLPARQWNNGDVDIAATVDVDQIRDWYAGLGLPWGVRVPAGSVWKWGERVFHGRMMGLDKDRFRPAAGPDPLTMRAAGPADLPHVAHVDQAAFGGQLELTRAWLDPHVQPGPVTTFIASLGDHPVATGYLVRADGRAGPTGCLGGVGVIPEARRRGIGLALSSRLVAHALNTGAELIVLSPDTASAADLYRRLGFTEIPGFDVYVDP